MGEPSEQFVAGNKFSSAPNDPGDLRLSPVGPRRCVSEQATDIRREHGSRTASGLRYTFKPPSSWEPRDSKPADLTPVPPAAGSNFVHSGLETGAGDPVARLLITRLINNAATSNEGRRAESEKEREREEGDRRLIIISGGATMSAVTMSEISSLAAGALHATETPRARVHSSRYVDF